MESGELERLRTRYVGMGDDELVDSVNYGPDAYASSEVWKIIAEEASRRGLAVPTVAQLVERDEVARAAAAAQRLPWGWSLYIRITRVLLIVLALRGLTNLVLTLSGADFREGWWWDVLENLGLLALVSVATWARHRQIAALAHRMQRRGQSS